LIKVGFAGLGRMGQPMALRLAEAGFDLAVYNRNRDRCEPLEAAGATVVETPAQLLADREVAITMLAGPAAVEQVVAGPGGVLSGADRDSVVVEMSTVGPSVARQLAQRAAEHGAALVDAPVSGSVPAAESGSLTAFAGGPEWALEKARPALQAFTAAVTHVGDSGSGAAVKLGLNTVLTLLNEGIAEALLLAEALGIEREAMYDALESSAVAAPYVGYKRGAFLGDAEAGEVAFDIDGLGKDIDLALSHGRRDGLPMFGAAAASQVLAAASGMGLGSADMAAVATALRRISSSSES